MFEKIKNALVSDQKQNASGRWVNGKYVKEERIPDGAGFEVAGLDYHMNEIRSFMEEIKKFKMSREKLKEMGYVGKKIYHYYFKVHTVQLIPEPTNPHDPNAIKVLINNVHIGYVPRNDTRVVSQIMGSGEVELSAFVSGGEYRLITSKIGDQIYSEPLRIEIRMRRIRK